MFRFLRRMLLTIALVGLAGLALGYLTAIRDPVVRQARVELPDWPAGEPPLRLLLLSDIHVAGPDMPPSRLARVVEQANALRPDLILFAGDFISDKRTATRWYRFDEALAPLAGLRAPLGSVAVLGNHDHWVDAAAATRALERAGIRTLFNDAVRAGPLVIGGLDDDFTGRADLARTLARMREVRGVPLVLSHSPDPFADLPRQVRLMLAGHTHCGQVALPWIGAISYVSRHGRRYACGRIDEGGRTLFVGAGIGTSVAPLRLWAVPDMWLIEVGPVSSPVR